LNENNIWQQQANNYHPSTDAINSKVLPPGVYRWTASMTGWWLEKTRPFFAFPYKIYGNHQHILDRIDKAWGALEGNLGILLNGLKGTGKSVTAQLIGNWAVEQDLIVLVVNQPISSLGNVLERINQDMVVIFDEFEKTHSKPEEQQPLLSALDGMSRNEFKRMFVFTSNIASIDTNFIDRPSRIRYRWEFKRMSEDVIYELIADMLLPEYQDLIPEIIDYLNSRKVCTIDTVKTAITEVNIFGQSPDEFKNALNLSEKPPASYAVQILNQDTLEVESMWATTFRPHESSLKALSTTLTKVGVQHFINDCLPYGRTREFKDRFRPGDIKLVEPTDDPHVWWANIQVEDANTWLSKFPKNREFTDYSTRYVDEKPEGWTIPEWARVCESKDELTGDHNVQQEEWEYPPSGVSTVYGTGIPLKVLIRFEKNKPWRSANPDAF